MSLEEESQIKIEVYGTAGCKYCRKAKATLTAIGLPHFHAINMDEVLGDMSILEGQSLQIERVEYTKTRTVPQIYVGSEHIGGCDSLLESIASLAFPKILERQGVKVGALPASVQYTNDDEFLSPDEELSPEQIIEKYKSYVMNDHESKDGETIVASPEQILQVSVELQTQALKLVDNFMNTDGSRVRYSAMRNSFELQEYVRLCSTLQRYRISDFSMAPENVRLSFFSNLYNSMIVHANCVLGPAKDSPASRSLFFSGKGGNKYNIFGYIFCPDDIEHGILRANTRHPSQDISEQSYWPIGDPRSALSLKTLDPRIHFILNCGASSCPPIKVLDLEPETALNRAANAYLHAETSFTPSSGAQRAVVTLPKLLMWYALDFGNSSFKQVQRICTLMEDSPLRRNIADVLLTSSETTLSFELKYGIYNWATNEDLV
jgi:glutaredoxin